MKRNIFIFTAFAGLCLFAADKLQPINAKLGLWEITMTRQTPGMPAAAPSTPSLPADKLAQLPPAQRAQIEAMMKQRPGGAGGGAPTVHQTCVTKDKLDKAPFSEDRKSCQRTIVTSTPTLVEIHEECTRDDGSKQIADAHYEITGTDTMKGIMKMKGTIAGRNMEMNMDLSGKWLGSDCGTVK